MGKIDRRRREVGDARRVKEGDGIGVRSWAAGASGTFQLHIFVLLFVLLLLCFLFDILILVFLGILI
jgi:hypothetical protein